MRCIAAAILVAVALIPATTAARTGRQGLIAFVSTRDGDRAIYVVREDGSGFGRLLRKGSAPTWSPGGRRLAIELPDERLAVLTSSNQRLATVEPSGLALGAFSWSPDGKRLAYALVDTNGIWVSTVDGRSKRRVTSGDDIDPAWSPDGTRIAFTRRNASSVPELDVLDLKSGEVKRLGGWDGTPRWSPGGKELAFAGGLQPGLWIVSASGGKRHLVAGVSDYVEDFAWSPDGTLIAAVMSKGLLFARPHGRPLAATTPRAFGPSWAPDGQRVAVEIGHDIWVVQTDGSKRRLTSGASFSYENSLPSWQPKATPPPLNVHAVRQAQVSDSQLRGNVLHTRAYIDLLAADGPRVAVAFPTDSRCIELWDTSARRLVRFAEDSCATDETTITGLALAGQRVAWELQGDTNHTNVWISTASESSSRILGAYNGVEDKELLGEIVGGGGAIAFESIWPTRLRILRLDGTILVPVHGADLRDIAGSRLVRSSGTRVFLSSDRAGRLASFEVGQTVTGAKIAGQTVAVLAGRTLTTWSIRSGGLLARRTLTRPGRLVGYAGGVAATSSGRQVDLTRLSDGAAYSVRANRPVKAAFTTAGLFVATNASHGGFDGSVEFMPRRRLLQHLR